MSPASAEMTAAYTKITYNVVDSVGVIELNDPPANTYTY